MPGRVPEDVGAAVAVEVAGDRAVLAVHRHGRLVHAAVGPAEPQLVAGGPGVVGEQVVVAVAVEVAGEGGAARPAGRRRADAGGAGDGGALEEADGDPDLAAGVHHADADAVVARLQDVGAVAGRCP